MEDRHRLQEKHFVELELIHRNVSVEQVISVVHKSMVALASVAAVVRLLREAFAVVRQTPDPNIDRIPKHIPKPLLYRAAVSSHRVLRALGSSAVHSAISMASWSGWRLRAS